jgi:hypothetical protein
MPCNLDVVGSLQVTSHAPGQALVCSVIFHINQTYGIERDIEVNR